MSLAEERPRTGPAPRIMPERAREVATRVHADPAAEERAPSYVGLVTRVIAFALDAALINMVALLVGVAVGLAVSILDLPSGTVDALTAIGGLAWFLWSALRLVRERSDAAARAVFRTSLVYLALLYAAMLADLLLT